MIIFQTIVILAFIFLGGYGCIMAAYDTDARRKNWRAGTHDYYGNRIE